MWLRKKYLYFTLFLTGLLAMVSLRSNAQCTTVVASFTTSVVEVCGTGPVTVNFTNTSTGAVAPSALYRWYLNGTQFDAGTGLGAPNSSTISGAGTYTYMLVGIDNFNNCIDTAYVDVILHPVPNAAFTFAPNHQCANVPINFTNNSTGADAYTTYQWDFGDGGSSVLANPGHQYAAGGTYTVTLTMTNGPGCTSTTTATVTTLPIPVINISGDDGDGDLINCLLPADPTTSETVTFFNTTTGAVSYTWDFGDGSPPVTTASTAPLTHTYTTFGTFTVTMTATHANGCTETATLTVVFEKYVSASLTLDILEYSGCAPHTLTTLQNLAVNANTYVWDFGDGSPPITTTSPVPPTHTYTTGGTYTITLTASNSCNTAQATISPIVIVDGPTANFTTSLPGNLGCAPQLTNFFNNSTNVQPANNYYWDMGNGNTYSNVVTPPGQTYSQGTWTIMMVAGNACGNDTVYQIIQIDTLPVVDLVVTPDTGCTPLTVTSTNNSTGVGLSYAWYIDGIYSYNTATIPNQTFTAPPGNAAVNHTIRLVVSNHCGTDDTTVTIVVHPAVQAIFTPTNPSICEGGDITFTESSLGDSLTWVWDFGNGQTANTAGPHTINYPTAGTYTVELIVNGYCGADTMTTTVTVNPIPVADIVPDVLSGCEDLVVNFTNNSTPGGTYNWNFGPEATPGTSTLYTPPAVTFLDSGLQMVILNIDLLGCTNSDTAYIDVFPLPLPSFTATPVVGCSPLDVAFTNTSPGNPGDVYAWNFGNGNTSAQQNPPNEIYTTTITPATFDVWLTMITPDGCTDSVMTQVTVNPNPVADFTPFPDTACALETVAFLNNSTGATSYQWDFGDGNTSATASPTHAYAGYGIYTVQLIASSGSGCNDTITGVVVVDSIPNADFNFSIECVGDSTAFTDLSTGGIVAWDWAFGDGTPNSSLQHPNHLYATAGTYNVTLTVTNAAGCDHVMTQAVTVNDVPVAAFTNTSTCLGAATQFTDLTSGVPISWQWDFGDGSPVDNTQHPTHTYGSVGTFNVTLIVGGGSGCSDTIAQTITVDSIPTSDFTFTSVCTDDTTFFTSTSQGSPDTYYWDFGDGTTDNTNNATPNHVYNTSGTYNVMLVTGYSLSGCTDTIVLAVDAFPRTNPGFTNNTPCLGAATLFTDTTTNAPTLWTWDFGDGSPVDNTQNPSHAYGAGGNYNVMLITENTFGCVDTTQVGVIVYPLPVAGFTFDTVCTGFATSFTDNAQFAVAWEWDFGDGSPLDNNASPQHTYAAAGQYNVQQVVTNIDGCTDTMMLVVDVWPNPVADFTATTACLTYPTTFTDNSTAAVAWEWDFGDGSPLNSQSSPIYTYAADGTYNVQLVVTNSYGCTDTIMQAVTVLPQPQAGFENTTVCARDVVQFTDTTIGAVNYWEWDFGDGSPIDYIQHPTHTYQLGGTYNITFIAGNSSGCLDTLYTTIDVFTNPTPDFMADTVCLFNITNFTDLSTDSVAINNFYWDFGDGNNSFAQHPTYIYQSPGTYSVSLTVTNVNGCDSTITQDVVVTDIPVADFIFDTVCVGSPTTFLDNSTGTPTSWIWDFGDGNTDNSSPIVTHTYASAGTYLASLIVSSGAGCTDQVFYVVTVSDVVQAGITAPPGVCDGELFQLFDNSTINGGVITGYNWDFGDGNTSTDQDPWHTYNGVGNYTITLSVTANNGCTSTTTQLINVEPLPVAGFMATTACSNQETMFTDTSTLNSGAGTITNWDWDFGDGNTSTDQNPTHQYGASGTYTVTLIVTSSAGCTDTIVGSVIVHPQPVADFSSTLECFFDSTNFTDLSTIGGGGVITSWTWDFDDGTSSTVQHPTHLFAQYNDSFNVSLIVETNFGCIDTVTHLVTTHPLVEFDYGPVFASGCAPFTADFVDNSTIASGSITSWLWDFDDNNFSFAQNPSNTYALDGSYYVSLTVMTSQGCTFTDTLSYPVVVYPQPVAGFYASNNTVTMNQPEVTFTDDSQGALYWEWDFGDFFGSNEQHPTHEYADTGQYVVTQVVMNGFGCTDTAITVIDVNGEFAFYAPNAFTPDGDGRNDFFYGTGFGIKPGEYNMYIFDRWGNLIFETDDMNVAWGGKVKGTQVDAQQDVYVWKVVLKDIFDEQHEFVGHVTLLR